MTFIILPKNTAKDAILVEQKAGTTTVIDDSTPVEVNVQQPIDASIDLRGQALGVGDLTVDAWGIQKVSHPVSLFASVFTFNIDPAVWFTYENGTQVYTSTDISSIDSAGSLLTTATNTTLLLESRECPRYQPNRGHLFSTALWCPNKANDGIRQWGVGVNSENGTGFRLKSDGLLYAVLMSGGVETLSEVIDTSSVSGFDVQKGNVYDIQYQWRGVGNYKFYINLTLVHTFANLGTLTALSMENPALPVHYYAERTTEDVQILIGCCDLASENGENNFHEVYNSSYAEGVSVSSNTPVMVMHNPLQINSQTNTRTMTLARISVNCSKKAVFKVWMTRDETQITGETLVALGNGSFIETDSTDMDGTATRATAVTIAGLNLVTSIPVEALTAREVTNPHRDRIEFPIVRGDYLIVTCSASTASADCVVEFGEQR